VTTEPPDGQELIRIKGRTLGERIIMLPGVSKDPVTTPAILALVAEFDQERCDRAAAAVTRAAELLRIAYPGVPCGGPLHLVIANRNIQDEHVQWAADHLEENIPGCYPALTDDQVAAVREVAPILVRLTLAERALVLMLLDDPWMTSPAGEAP
jgi:hypothetical protein